MALGYAKWFEQAWRRCVARADGCQPCREGLCQTADHFESFWDHLSAKAVRQAEHGDWGALFQFEDGTIYQHAEGVGIAQALTKAGEREQANGMLDQDWHNEGVPRPPYQPLRVRTKRKNQT